MADEALNESTAPATPEPTPSSPPVPPAIALRTEIADRLSTSVPQVRELVVSELTNQEITKRKDAVLNLLTAFDTKSKELKKEEGKGTFALNLKGDKVGEATFTEVQVKAMKKLRDDIDGISAALTAFFEKGDTKKLYEVASKKGGDEKKDAAPAE